MGQPRGPFPWVLIGLYCIPIGVVVGGILIGMFLLKGQ